MPPGPQSGRARYGWRRRGPRSGLCFPAVQGAIGIARHTRDAPRKDNGHEDTALWRDRTGMTPGLLSPPLGGQPAQRAWRVREQLAAGAVGGVAENGLPRLVDQRDLGRLDAGAARFGADWAPVRGMARSQGRGGDFSDGQKIGSTPPGAATASRAFAREVLGEEEWRRREELRSVAPPAPLRARCGPFTSSCTSRG